MTNTKELDEISIQDIAIAIERLRDSHDRENGKIDLSNIINKLCDIIGSDVKMEKTG